MNYDPFVKDDFVLPEKWCIKSQSRDQDYLINEFARSSGGMHWSDEYNHAKSNYLNIRDGEYHKGSQTMDKYYTEITFDQFKKYVLKQSVEESKEIISKYVECLENHDNQFTKGKIYKIANSEFNSIGVDSDDNGRPNGWHKKFFKPSTKEAFDAQNQPKQPLKQAVHCKTQKEWDFVTNKLGYKWTTGSFDENSSWISLDSNQHSSENYWGKHGYQILSFQEWCDLNGYKMEKEVKFEVGKWYKLSIKNQPLNYLLKCSKLNGKSFYYSQYIILDKSKLINSEVSSGLYSIDMIGDVVSIEEIQQYLPDSHPDKIKVDREFKVGEYIFVMTKGRCYRDILKITSVESDEKDSGIKGTVWIKHENNSFSGGGFRLGSKYRYNEHVRHATPEEVNQHLISIEQIPAGEPLNTGIEPNKDGMFKYKQTMPGASWSGGTIDNHLDVMIQSKTQSEIKFNYLPEPK